MYQDIFCKCRRSFFSDDAEVDHGLFMAVCAECGEWYHRRCVKISGKVFTSEEEAESWKCPSCK